MAIITIFNFSKVGQSAYNIINIASVNNLVIL
jgi:hypothetical protein